VSYYKNKSGGTRIRCEMEIKEFRIACGEAVGLGDIGRKEWERPGKALVPPGISWSKGMFAPRGPRHVDGTAYSESNVVSISSGRSRLASASFGFGRRSAQKRHRPVYIEEIFQPKDLFAGWDLEA
jgi:hypothetical protein